VDSRSMSSDPWQSIADNPWQLVDIEVLDQMCNAYRDVVVSLSEFGNHWHQLLDAVHRDEAEPGVDAMSPDTSQPYPFLPLTPVAGVKGILGS
jgi:hypothetical protein